MRPPPGVKPPEHFQIQVVGRAVLHKQASAPVARGVSGERRATSHADRQNRAAPALAVLEGSHLPLAGFPRAKGHGLVHVAEPLLGDTDIVPAREDVAAPVAPRAPLHSPPRDGCAPGVARVAAGAGRCAGENAAQRALDSADAGPVQHARTAEDNLGRDRDGGGERWGAARGGAGANDQGVCVHRWR